jgi:hypothetical protein
MLSETLMLFYPSGAYYLARTGLAVLLTLPADDDAIPMFSWDDQ